jgi:hypothetical protein
MPLTWDEPDRPNDTNPARPDAAADKEMTIDGLEGRRITAVSWAPILHGLKGLAKTGSARADG